MSGRSLSASCRSPGPILQAQPAPWTVSVRRTFVSSFMAAILVRFPPAGPQIPASIYPPLSEIGVDCEGFEKIGPLLEPWSDTAGLSKKMAEPLWFSFPFAYGPRLWYSHTMGNDGFRNITMQQLEVLIHLVEAGSFTHAAQRMALTQPTLTKHIRNLEDAAGTRVVERKNIGISLTPEGRILYDLARRILRLREEAQEKIRNLKDSESGPIFLCASTIPATYILPRLLGALKKRCPEIRIHIQTGDSEETIQAILADQAEMGIIGKGSPDRRLKVEPLWEDRLLIALPAGHPWAKRTGVPVAELVKVPFVLRERGSGTRSALEGCLAKQGAPPLASFSIACEMGSSEAVKEAILAGLGVSILSIHAMERELAQGLLAAVPLEDCPLERRFYLIYKKQFRLMKHHRRFLSVIKNFKI
jgi:DNA-binding transcriptional LysR family regulator